MIEALWSVQFGSNLNDSGAGVVVLETGRVLGGDSAYTYIGKYSTPSGEVHARIKVAHYAGQPSSIFGPAKEFELELKGRLSREQFTLAGYVVGRPDLRIEIALTRRAELP